MNKRRGRRRKRAADMTSSNVLTMSLSSTRASSMNLATERMSRFSLPLADSNMPTTSRRKSGVSDLAARFFRFPVLPPAFGETAQPWEVNHVLL